MRYLLIFILILGLCLPKKSAYSQPKKDNGLWLGSYKLHFKKLKPDTQYTLNTTLKCIDEFDYVYLQGHLIDTNSACEARVKTVSTDLTTICDSSKAQIRKRCELNELHLRSSIKTLVLEKKSLDSELKSAKSSHSSQMIKMFVLSGILSTALITTTVLLIQK